MSLLPIHEALPGLRAALSAQPCAVLVAPPGAGKTTVVPLALLEEPWATGRIIVLEPRRLAARAAANRMAWTLNEPVGATVGYRVRMDAKVSAKTRVEVVTEGIFTRMILDDPGLDGVCAVLFDEFHERSLDADLGLALAFDSLGVLRPDLKLLVMSATLEGGRVSRLLGDAPVIESQGRMFEVATRHISRDPRAPIEDQVVKAIQRGLAEEEGSLLVFLPGQGEIQRVAQRLAERISDPAVLIAPLYGALDNRDQDLAIAPAPAGKRKVVLATSIAETSLTIEGVRVVIDAGLSRVPRFDPSGGITRLETVRVSKAAADQRRGRAGRTAPGVCYRLWDEPETRSLPAYARPEILDTDLSSLALDLARWGAKDVTGLAFLDPPPNAAMSEARALLTRLGALDANGALTAHGAALADLPLPPRLAHMVVRGAASGQGERAANIAAILTERGLGGRDADLTHRLDGLERDRSPRGRDARALAGRWARSAGHPKSASPLSDALLLAEAFPERIAKARGGAGEFQLANGRGVYVDPDDALSRAAWLAVGELGGGEARDRVLLAAVLDPAELRTAFADRFATEDRLEEQGAGLRAKRIVRLGRLVIEERLIDAPHPALIAEGLVQQVREKGLAALAFGEAGESLRGRVAFLRASDPSWPDLSDEALLATVDTWLKPLLLGKRALSALSDGALEAAMRAMIPWEMQRRLDAEAPARFTAPTGSSFRINYGDDGGPRVDVRVQELFGLAVHPTVGGQPLTLALLSPGHRPVQLTKDLPGFWKGSWADVRKDMRGRYPKHPWPEDPANATPTTRAKPRGT